MYSLSIILFVVALYPIYLGWKALIFETTRAFSHNDWQKESGFFGITGSIVMAMSGYTLMNEPNTYIWNSPNGMDLKGVACVIYMIATITFIMCGLAWFSKTKIAFWIDNSRWPNKGE